MRGHVAAARVGRLATITPQRHPHVVPICFTLHGDSIYSVVDFKPKTTIDLARLENVRAHPGVALVVDRYDDEQWNRLWWVRVDGVARVIEGGVEHTTAIQLLRTKYPQYQQHRPVGAVIAIDCRRWTGWAATDSTTRLGRQPARRE